MRIRTTESYLHSNLSVLCHTTRLEVFSLQIIQTSSGWTLLQSAVNVALNIYPTEIAYYSSWFYRTVQVFICLSHVQVHLRWRRQIISLYLSWCLRYIIKKPGTCFWSIVACPCISTCSYPLSLESIWGQILRWYKPGIAAFIKFAITLQCHDTIFLSLLTNS